MKYINRNKKLRRKMRVSSNIRGIEKKPRISVFRSNKYIYAQAIDDERRKTIVSFSSLKLKDKKNLKKIEIAKEVGKKLAQLLLDKGIREAIFDRNWYSYKGQVKVLAEGLREGGIKI